MISFPLSTTREKINLAKALSYINRMDDLKPFVHWIETEHDRILRCMSREKDEAVLRQYQGATQTLNDILNEIRASDDRFREFKEQESEDAGLKAAIGVPRF